jgi:hypothetical protein
MVMGEEDVSKATAPTNEELERLKAENEALKANLAVKKKRGGGFWRGLAVWILIVLACFLALGGSLSVWVKTTTLDTNTFVKTVAPLVKDDAVATAVSNAAVKQLFATYDVTGKLQSGLDQLDAAIKQALPPNAPIPDVSLSAIAKPVSNGLQTVAQKIAKEILQSKAFYTVWEKSLTTAHELMVNVVTGKKDAVITSQGDTVVLNLGELLTQIKDQLVQSGLTFLEKVPIPADFGQIELFTSKQLGAAKSGVKLLNTLSWVLPLLSLIFFALAVGIAKNKRRTLMGAGIGLAVAMLLTLILLKVTHAALFDMIKEQNLAAANIIWSTVLSGLKQGIRGLLALGLVVSIGAAVAGPYKWAVWLRSHTNDLFVHARERRTEEGAEEKPFYAFINKYAWWLRGAGIAIAVIVLVALPTISGLAIIITAIVLLVYLGLVELLR